MKDNKDLWPALSPDEVLFDEPVCSAEFPEGCIQPTQD